MKKLNILFTIICTTLYCINTVSAQDNTLIKNVRIFDGEQEKLSSNHSILIENNLIKEIGVTINAPEGATIIDANGKVLTPGYIGAHEHLIGQMPFTKMLFNDTRYMGYVAAWAAEIYLMSGFTTVRDAAGNTFSLKKAIDEGYVKGPLFETLAPIQNRKK